MSTQSLNQLDNRIKQVSIRELVDMNLLAQKNEMKQETRGYNLFYIIASVYTVITLFPKLADGSTADMIYFGFTSIILIISIWSLIKGGKTALLAVALGASLIGIYNLIVISILNSQIQIINIILGAINIIFALYYIQRANHYDVLENYSIRQSESNKALYQDVMKTLSLEKPDKTNNLILLQEITQEITVWLRPTFVVIYLHHEKRLFFDTNRSFELVINGQDKGGDKINVLASIIDSKRSCSISRYGWLRYIQFVA